MVRNNSVNHQATVERVIVTMTALALNCPSTFTIAWSKDQHPQELPILYAGIGSSLLTALGALVDDRVMWAGLLASIGLFGYTVFFYKSPSLISVPVGDPLIIGSPNEQHVLMV